MFAEKMSALENHLIELKDTYELDHNLTIFQAYMAHCVLRNVPATIRNGIFNKLNKLDPSLEEIFRSAQGVIRKINFD